MAAPPVKSQPLHNFSLPHLKWAHKGPSPDPSGSSSHHHRFRRRDSPDQRCHRSPDPENPTQQPPADYPRNDGVLAAPEEEDNGDGRPWKLRRRKESVKAASTPKMVCAEKNDKKADSNCNGIKSQRLRGMVEGGQLSGGGAEKKGKRRVWISLSREEIEEDVYALTGGKPARRPKKWPKNVQKQLDNVFPGLYLVGVTADSYRAMMQWQAEIFDVDKEVGESKGLVCCNGYLVEVYC
ncbi:hypothetical protein CASFOL_040691 [Castilleja foliolosa]|uniref:Uncharacterized protein n=1 Tax=Castilleja foliolosa TaxID=1961234 RepID=A0ABD3BCC8_9LAMI